MKRIIFQIILLQIIFSASIHAIDTDILTKAPSTKGPWIVRAYFDQTSQIQALSDITAIWDVETKQKFAVIEISNENQFNKIQALGYKIRIDSKMQNKHYNKIVKNNIHAGNDVISGYACYSTVEGTYNRMDSMNDEYSDLVELIDIGETWEKTENNSNGYDLKVLKITNKDIKAEKPILFITSAIHAREYTTAELNTRFAEYLLSQYGKNADVTWMLDYQEIHLILQSNPDGRKRAETGILWRKNTNLNYCNSGGNLVGADLNRNYPFAWVNNINQCEITYSGPVIHSEPEVDSIVTYMRSIYADNRGPNPNDAAPDETSGIFVDIHSHSQLILWPWGYTSIDSANANQFSAFGKRVAYYNEYKPQPASSLYTVTGGSIDTSYGELGVASLVYELGTAFFQDCEEFESKILPDNLASLIYVSRVTRAPYIAPLGPDIENLKIVPNYIVSGQTTQVYGKANDNRYNQSNGNQSYENISSIDLFVNDLPWLDQNNITVNAFDGVFDNEIETFKHEIDTKGLSQGDQTVYMRATDINGKKGGIYSKFLHVIDQSSFGTLSGKVTNALTGESINQSSISINGSHSESNTFGNYFMYVPPSTEQLYISSEGYAPMTFDNISIIQQQELVQNIQLQPYCSLYQDDMESGTQSWVPQGTWAIVDNQSSSPTHSWTDSPSVDYTNDSNTTLTSESFSISSANNLEINFNHKCDTEAGYDYGILEVNFDKSSWQEVYYCHGSNDWASESIPLNVPEGSQNIQVRFRLYSDGLVTQDGWYIDDFELKGTGAPCATLFDDTIFEDGFEK